MSGHQPSRLGRAFAIALAAGLTGCEPAPPLPAVPRAPDGSAFEYDGCAEATSEPTRTLVLRDDAGSEPWLAELHGVAVSAVISHFGAYASKRVSRYCAGEILAYRAVVYVGSTYHQHLPGAFLEDVLSGARPVVWLGANLNDLAARPEFLSRYGFLPVAPGPLRFGQVRYKGVLLARFADSPATLAKLDVQEPGRVTTLAEAIALDGTAQPWAVRSANLTYVAENPVAYIDHDNRYLAFCDLLFDVLAPLTPARHRALVRIEDVHPLSSPVALRAIADYLHDEGVPFSVAVIPSFQDPRGTMHGGVPQARTLVEAPAVVDALAYMVARGGTLVMHGYTHQHRDLANPYSATTGADYEFFRAHVGDSGAVVMDGPLPGDTGAWALERADKGLSIFRRAGLPRPQVFEYPHYAGSALDSRALAERFPMAYQRELYFAGPRSDDPRHWIGMFFPYPVRDLYGWRVIPENLGNYIPPSVGPGPGRSAEDIVQTARRNLVVRDGFASFFFHPIYDVAVLRVIVQGIKAAGYTFVGVSALDDD